MQWGGNGTDLVSASQDGKLIVWNGQLNAKVTLPPRPLFFFEDDTDYIYSLVLIFSVASDSFAVVLGYDLCV